MKPTLAVMVKLPRPGRVKTRLGNDIGMVRAAWWARHRIPALIRAAQDPRWRIVLAVTPDRDALSRSLPPLPRVAQGRGDLGLRMIRVFNNLNPGPVLIIGTDIPAISRQHIAQGFAALGQHDTVFGPATDGGYWAIGMKHTGRIPADLFQGVRWSSEHALRDSWACIRGRKTASLPTLADIDLLNDLAPISP